MLSIWFILVVCPQGRLCTRIETPFVLIASCSWARFLSLSCFDQIGKIMGRSVRVSIHSLSTHRRNNIIISCSCFWLLALSARLHTYTASPTHNICRYLPCVNVIYIRVREKTTHAFNTIVPSLQPKPIVLGFSFLFLFFLFGTRSGASTQRNLVDTRRERISVSSFSLPQPEPFRFICRTSGAERVSKDIARPRATLGAQLRNASPDFKLIKWSSIEDTPPCAVAALLFCNPPPLRLKIYFYKSFEVVLNTKSWYTKKFVPLHWK